MLDAVRQLIDPNFHPEQLAQFDSPRFLKPLPARMAPDDVEYLRSKGALAIPETPLRNELLRAYVKWVHSSLPVLDLHSFLEAVAINDADANISLLLFQAVMFAGTAFVDVKHLRHAGFATRREARMAFFNNARLLYSLDCEDDRLAAIQAILLFTYYYEKDNLQKDIWHWVGVCNTQAQSIGLHRDPTRSDIPTNEKSLRIRLWWCLYMRDRLICLALHRPTQINEGACNVPLPGLSDFDIGPFHAAVDDILLDCGYMGDVFLQRRLAIMLIEKIKLCQCLGRVLFAQYAPYNVQSGSGRQTTITLVPRQSSDAELRRCSQRLDAWLSGLPEEAAFIAPREKKWLRPGDDVLYLHSSMLQMIYHATYTSLYRPRALASSTANAQAIIAARKKIRDAASETAETASRLRNLGLTPFLPTYGLTVMTPAAMVHLTHLNSSNPVERDRSTWNFRLCIDVIRDMRDIYPAADYESGCLEMAIYQLQQGLRDLPTMSMIMLDTSHRHRMLDFPNIGITSYMMTGHSHPQSRSPPPIRGDTPMWTDWSTYNEGQYAASFPAQANNTITHSRVGPRALTYNDDNDDDDDDYGHGHNNNSDDIEFGNTWQPTSILASLTDEHIITGDLERDLGLI